MNSESQVLKTVKRSNMTTIIISVLTLVVVIGLVVISSGPYWMAQLTGPNEITSDDLIIFTGSERLYNVAVSGLDMDDTYYYEETIDEDTGRQVRIDAYFGALEIGKDKWILVRHPEEINTRQEDYVGTIQPVSGEITRQVYDLAADELGIEFLPVMLDTTRNEVMWWVGTAILAVLGLASIWGVVAYIQRSSDPSKHPILKKLARYGDVEQVVHAIDKDLTLGEDNVGKLRLTRSYLLHKNGNNFDAMPYNAVAWVYKMVKSGKYGKTYEAHIYDVTGYELVIVGKEKDVNMMLEAVLGRAPWAIGGFAEDIKQTWRNNRKALIDEVKRRRQEANQS